MPDAPLSFGPFLLEREAMRLTREGRSVALGSRGTALLSALAVARGGVVSREALIEAAWPGRAVEEANLTVQVAALRRALGAWADAEREWIVTVPRVGYRLVVESAPGPPAVAVLPFENLSSDPEQSYLADGIVEDLITALSRFRTFSVVARNSTFAYKGRAVDVRSIARDLGVRYVLEGSVRRSGSRVRISAQLIEGGSGAHLWADTFDGAGVDIFDFQDEITRSVIGLIEPQIRRAEIERVRQSRPESLGAWDLYLQALPLVYAADAAGYTTAIGLLDRALAIDPAYGPALAMASFAHEKRRTFGGVAPPGVDDAEVAMALAGRALQVDPQDATALALLGWQRILFRRDYGGLALCARAYELNPNNRAVLDLVSVAHLFAGRLDDAIACATRALELSPGAPDAYMCANHISSAHLFARRFHAGIEWAQRSIDLEGRYVFSHLNLAVGRAHLGQIESARLAMNAVMALRPDFTIGKKGFDCHRFPERRDVFIEGQRMAGMPEA